MLLGAFEDGIQPPVAAEPSERPLNRPADGSVSARANKYSWPDEGRDFSGGLQHPQNRCGAAKEVEPAVVGGDWLIGSGAGTEKVAQFVVDLYRTAWQIVGT